MLKKDLDPFTVDDISNVFTPTVTRHSGSPSDTPSDNNTLSLCQTGYDSMIGDRRNEGAPQSYIQLVGFYLGREEFAIDIQKVQEINRMVEITRVPRTPEFVEGVMNLRGKVVPVINLRKRLDFPEKEDDKRTRIVVVEIQGRILGLVVDAMSEVLRIPAGTIGPPPKIMDEMDTDFIMGVGKLEDRLLILLDLDRIISQEKSAQLNEVV